MTAKAHKTSFDTQTFGKVAVLMGGWSAERTISLRSGQAVLDALYRKGIDAHGIDVHRQSVLNDLQQSQFDRAFVILHGPGGEDGVIQGALEIMGIPYTGSGVLASALAMDKLRSKQLIEAAGLPTPDYMVLDENTDFEYAAATLGLPIMVKPSLEGSSIGMTKVTEVEQLLPAWQKAAQFDGAVIAERWIEGSEYTIAILDEAPLPAIRLETPREFYDYEAKYQANDTRYLCPCGLAKEEEGRLQRLALSVFKTVGAKGWGRVDILCSPDNKPWVIELNTVPGMTDHSLVPMAAKVAGIEFDELVCRILALTIAAANNTGNKEPSHVGAC